MKKAYMDLYVFCCKVMENDYGFDFAQMEDDGGFDEGSRRVKNVKGCVKKQVG